MKVSVIIPCAGSGNRFGDLKQFKILNGEPLFSFTLKPFLDLKEVLEIIIAVPSLNLIKQTLNVWTRELLANNINSTTYVLLTAIQGRTEHILL